MHIRFSLVVAAAALAGCAGGGGSSAGTSTSGEWDAAAESEEPVAIKLSYVRYEPDADSQGRTKGWKHTYKFLLSSGWMTKRGPSPREPFERYWRRDAWVGENIHDSVLGEWVAKLEEAGLMELRETPLNKIDMERLLRIERTDDKDAALKTRIITVETEKYRRTVTSYDNGDPAQMAIFIKVERLVVAWVYGNTIQVTKESPSTMPRGKN